MTDSKSGSDPLGELDRWARFRVRVSGLVAALLLAMLLVATQNVIRPPLFDAYQRLLKPPAPSPKIVVVVVDAQSLAQIGGWPWSRYVMARLAEEIGRRGAVAIGFDFLFPERDRQTPADFVKLYYELSPAAAAEIQRQQSMDDIFATVIGRQPVVLSRVGVGGESYDSLDRDEAGASAQPFPPEARFLGPQPPAIPTYPGVLTNLDMLDGAAAGHGLANGPPDRDGVVRRVPLLGKVGGVLTPSLALDMVRVAEGGDAPIRLEGDAHELRGVSIGRHRTPVEPGGQVLLRFTDAPPGPHGEPRPAYRAISAVDLLRQGIPDDAFRGKIVLVGLAAAGTSDVVNTPREGRTYGVFVQAQTIDAILRGEGLRAPLWARLLEWGVGLLCVLISWFGVPRAQFGFVVVGAIGELAAAFGGSWLAFQHNILLDPIPMLLPGAANSAVMVVLLFIEGRRVQARLRSDLDDERLGAARMSGELAAASEIQAGMLLPRRELARVTPHAQVDAVLQPARTVGGDLYDAFLIDPERLCFLTGDVTGKGVPASLFMALCKALARSLLMRPGADLASSVAQINAELSRDNGQMMAVSMLVGVLRLSDGALELCNAGHENPLVIQADGSVREMAMDGGPPLCVDETFPYPVETARLAAGETFVVLTDGVTEAQSPQEELFGRARAIAAIQGRRPLAEIVDGLIAAVRAFEGGGDPSDDITVLAVRLSGR